MKQFLAFLFLIFFVRAAAADQFNAGSPMLPNQVDAGTKTLNQLVAEIGANTRTLVISQPLPALTGNLTVPANVTIECTGDCRISCGSSTLTIQSSTANWPSRQIFASDCLSTGSVSFSENRFVEEVRPEWWGAVADGSRDNQTELLSTATAAATAGLRIRLGSGTYMHSGTLAWLRSGIEIEGVSNQSSVLFYTGSGIQVATLVPGTVVFRPAMKNMWLSTATGTIGLDLDSVKEGKFQNLLVTGFATACIDIHGAVPGNSVYNRFWNVKAQSCGIGHRVQGTSHNANVWDESRANACAIGWQITDSGDNTIINSQSEANSDSGIVINATGPALATRNRVDNVRLENNTNYGLDLASTDVLETKVEGLWLGSNGTDIRNLSTRMNGADDLLYVSSLGNITAKSGSIVSANSVFLGSTTGAFAGTTNGSANIKGQVANGATAVGVKISNTNTLNTSGAKIVQFCADSVCADPAMELRSNGSVYGWRFKSPDGTWYLMTIANGGTVSITANP